MGATIDGSAQAACKALTRKELLETAPQGSGTHANAYHAQLVNGMPAMNVPEMPFGHLTRRKTGETKRNCNPTSLLVSAHLSLCRTRSQTMDSED